MKKIKTLLFTLTFFAMSLAGAKTFYPVITSVEGKVAWFTGSDGKKVPAKKQTLLRGKAEVETGASSQIKIQWDTQRELTVLENTSVGIPAIAWETGEAPLILVKSGAVRWKAPASSQGAYHVAMHSDLFQFITPPADFIISFHPEKAFVEVKMLKGRMEFSAMNAEEMVLLQSGQKVGFQGVKEEGKVAYDVLLQGRKIPRGRLTAVSSLDKLEMNLTAQEEAREKSLKEQQRLAKTRAEEKRQTAGQICLNPAARLNECSWTCDGNPKKEKKICHLEDPAVSCVRRRCNANGQWAEALTLEAAKAKTACKAEAQVGPCDY